MDETAMLQSQLEVFMELRERLQNDLKEAMRSGDGEKRNVLRMVMAAIKQVEVDSRITLTPEGVQDVLIKQVKQRQESIADFERAGRGESVAGERAQLKILESYLPQQLSRNEIEALATTIIAGLGLTGPKAIGQVMSQLMPLVKGKADGKLVSEVVRDLLA